MNWKKIIKCFVKQAEKRKELYLYITQWKTMGTVLSTCFESHFKDLYTNLQKTVQCTKWVNTRFSPRVHIQYKQ